MNLDQVEDKGIVTRSEEGKLKAITDHVLSFFSCKPLYSFKTFIRPAEDFLYRVHINWEIRFPFLGKLFLPLTFPFECLILHLRVLGCGVKHLMHSHQSNPPCY